MHNTTVHLQSVLKHLKVLTLLKKHDRKNIGVYFINFVPILPFTNSISVFIHYCNIHHISRYLNGNTFWILIYSTVDNLITLLKFVSLQFNKFLLFHKILKALYKTQVKVNHAMYINCVSTYVCNCWIFWKIRYLLVIKIFSNLLKTIIGTLHYST